jgi:hypothetical protein
MRATVAERVLDRTKINSSSTYRICPEFEIHSRKTEDKVETGRPGPGRQVHTAGVISPVSMDTAWLLETDAYEKTPNKS